ALEQSREVRLISETGTLRDVGEARATGLEQAPRALETQGHQVLMWRSTQRLLECARKMGGRQSDFTRQHLDGQASTQGGIDHFEHAALPCPRQTTANADGPWLLDSRMPHQQMPQRRGNRFDQR